MFQGLPEVATQSASSARDQCSSWAGTAARLHSVNPTSCERAVLRHVLFLFQDLIPTLGRAVLSPHTASSPLTQQGSCPNLLLQRGRFFISRRFALQSWEAAYSAALPVKLNKKRKGRPASPPWGAPPEVVPLSFLEGGPSLQVSSSWDVGIRLH